MSVHTLRPPSHASANDVPVAEKGDFVFIPFRQHGRFGTRADPAHLALQDIKNLGQFVDTAAAQETAEAGDTIIVGACDRVITRAGLVDRAGSHSAELVDDERLATESDPLLADRKSVV